MSIKELWEDSRDVSCYTNKKLWVLSIGWEKVNNKEAEEKDS